MRYDSLTEAVRLLGCFTAILDIQPIADSETVSDKCQMFDEFFFHCKESRLVCVVENGIWVVKLIRQLWVLSSYKSEHEC